MVGRRGRYAVPEHIEPRCSQTLLRYLIIFLCKIYSAAEGINTEFITFPCKYEHGKGKSVSGSPAQQLAGGGWVLTAAAARRRGGGGGTQGAAQCCSCIHGVRTGLVWGCAHTSSKPTGPRLQLGQGRSRAARSSPFPWLSCGQQVEALRAAAQEEGRQRSAHRNFCSVEECFAKGGDLRAFTRTKSSTGVMEGGGGALGGAQLHPCFPKSPR